MNQSEIDKIYFNQNMIYYKDKIYNSGGSLEISICNNTIDYKSFSAPTLQISVIGENNLRRICSLNYPDSVDLFTSLKDVLMDIETIYSTARSNIILKKYQYDKSLKFEFIQVQGMGDRVVIISVIHSNSDFTKVIVPFNVFTSFSIGILKYFVNDYVNISFSFSNRNLLTEILEQNKLIRNGIMILPSSILENNSKIISSLEGKESPQVAGALEEDSLESASLMSETLDDFDKFLGKNMENIKVEDLESKAILEEKPKNLEITSLLITKTLNKDLSVLESMLTSSSTRPDPMIAICEGFRRSMNLNNDFSFLPEISKNDLKSFLYISKIYHDLYLNLYINKNTPIPSGFQILKYDPDLMKADSLNISLAYDLLLIMAFVKIFRGKMESRESDASKNGAIFYLRLRCFVDAMTYSFLDVSKFKIITSTICNNFEKYLSIGFFKHYQDILINNGFKEITIKEIGDFCVELNDKVFQRKDAIPPIKEKHEVLNRNDFLRIKSENNLSIEQIINELIPLEVLEKTGADLREESETLKKLIESLKISKEVLNIFFKRKEEKVKKDKDVSSNILKTVKYFNNEIPETFRDKFFEYISNLKDNNFDFNNSDFPVEELGESIIKSLYVWNESENKKEPLTTFRTKLEESLLTKELILVKYKTNSSTEPSNNDEWNFNIEN